ncbi:MAG TPA: formylglycine-generating enzyme family protein [Bradyrhizobium sp.]|uniref:formylglycine-generating enzyme family protein n=1 Tax=Bradyrhizobium sp. TaxID=376 RepID=UPI002CB370D1|nr:formylglycine-generating enzyme family protein [Bradyrhizobium sp.]HLZ00970.1 formylglycine-generating enzyme family protein [Bradyrhizobium sp.]
MVFIPGGTFLMGSNAFYREERPVQRVSTDGFWIDRFPVTNAQFRRFVDATGYVTFSERAPTREMYPDAAAEFLVPGSLVFVKPPRPVSLRDYRAWWAYVPGANWRHPNGPNSSIAHRDNHPVVHVAYEDASAYAAWAGKALPGEVEWEYAARGGLEGAAYPWGDAANPEGRFMANTWQGRFPFENLAEDGYEGTSPVDAFPPNGYGLHDMVGNVWEWTSTPYASSHDAEKSCCHRETLDQRSHLQVVKGGSHLCAPNYCLRFRPAARQGETRDSSTCHIGFRCIVREPS